MGLEEMWKADSSYSTLARGKTKSTKEMWNA